MPSSTSASSSSLFHIVPLDRRATRRHAMDTCYLCGKPLSRNLDIFMYRGHSILAARRCRGVQMDRDEARQKINSNILNERAARNKEHRGAPASEPNVTCAANVPVAS